MLPAQCARASGLQHYVVHGRAEGRRPHAEFGVIKLSSASSGVIADLAGNQVGSHPDHLRGTNIPAHACESSFAASFLPRPAIVHALSNVTVYGRYFGVVVDGALLAESSHLLPLDHTYATIYSIRQAGNPPRRLQRAALGSNAVSHNYYHWIMESLFAAYLARHEILSAETRLITPELSSAQQHALQLIGIPTERLFQLRPDESVAVEQLLYPVSLFGDLAFSPNPAIMRMFETIKAAVNPITRSDRMLYVSRRDSTQRIMENEGELEERLSREGFEIIVASTLSFTDQVRLFAEANLIVAPHGAGLTNIGFADPGTSLYELFPESYANPCFCRLAQLGGLRYTADMFPVLGLDETDIHARHWRVDVDRVVRRTLEWASTNRRLCDFTPFSDDPPMDDAMKPAFVSIITGGCATRHPSLREWY